MWRIFITGFCTVAATVAQDYEVSDIQCSGLNSLSDLLIAKIKRPNGFRGNPLFADERITDPLTDVHCQIRPDPNDPQEDNYFLKVNDFTRCGVLKRNNFIHLRIWFPMFPGVIMLADQELILMCRPPEPTILRHKAAGFSGTLPHAARISGIIEETPGRLEYEVALYREANGNNSDLLNGSNASETVDQAVPIGTKLQLRAHINSESVWNYIKLIEVTVSPDPNQPNASGSISLVKDGCRNREFASIIPHQPARYHNKNNEIYLDFEAFLLSSTKDKSTLWIHSQIKACMEPQDCQPEFCLDFFEPSSHGKRRKRTIENQYRTYNSSREGRLIQRHNNSMPITKFKDNIEYTVIKPADFYDKTIMKFESSCGNFLYVAAGLSTLLILSALSICYLGLRLHSLRITIPMESQFIHNFGREGTRKCYDTSSSYTGRSLVQ